MSKQSYFEHEREVDRLKRMPGSIILDFIMNFVQKLLNQLEEAQLTKGHFKVLKDDYTNTVMEKNDYLQRENDRMCIDNQALSKEVEAFNAKRVELQLEIDSCKEVISQAKQARKEEMEHRLRQAAEFAKAKEELQD